jgi:hypothetical protein
MSRNHRSGYCITVNPNDSQFQREGSNPMRTTRLLPLLLAPMVFAFTLTAAEPPSASGLSYTEDGKLMRPANYREWVTIGTGLNMTYGPAAKLTRNTPAYTNVLVSPVAYRAFLGTGAWPDKMVFMLEIRAAMPVNAVKNGNNSYFQGEVLGIEAEVKDTQRFPNGWGFFNLGSGTTGTLIPSSASCYSCHAKNAAVENTFVQFYPELRDVAKQKGTFKTVSESF